MNIFKKILDRYAEWLMPDIRTSQVPDDHPIRQRASFSGHSVDRDWSLCTFWQRIGILLAVQLSAVLALLAAVILYALFVNAPVFMIVLTAFIGGMYLIAKKVN